MAANKTPRALDKLIEKQAAEQARRDEAQAAFEAFMEDCHYPVSKDGKVMDASYFSMLVGYHMVRCGWRRSVPPVIKKRPVDAPGTIEGAVEWVDISAPDDPLEGIEKWTFAQVAALPEYLRRKAIVRLGGNAETDDDLPEMGEPAWQVTPNISYSAEPPTASELINEKDGDG